LVIEDRKKGFKMEQTRHGPKRKFAGWKAGMVLVATVAIPVSAAVTVSPQEMAQKDQWARQNLLTAANLPPFSFFYGEVASSKMLPSWGRVEADTTLDSNRIQHVLTWRNDAVQVQCVAVDYRDYPMVEWTVYIKNVGTISTPILQGIQGLDITLLRTNGPEFVLNGNQGDFTTADSYEPFQTTLTPSFTTNFAPSSYSGKSCDGPRGWPYYNLQMPGGGIILAIGWPAEWASSFTRDAGDSLRIQAGQQLTHLTLRPGETIRTPLIALLFWQGTDVVRAQNVWRHWYLAHEIPRVNGQPAPAMTQIQVSGSDTNAVQGFLQAGIKPDICWRDAGGDYTWYPSSTGPYHGGDSYLNTGTWEVDPTKYSNGFKPFSDWIHARGMKFLLWFEPERIGDPNSWLGTNHPEWLLPGESHGSIFNEGNPEALNWLTHHIDGLIKSNGIDWYREDMNGEGPLPTWRKHDAPDRQGITENFYAQGHLAYWDALVAANPGLRIDSCASGGRRNDLETMRRAVPLTRSDFEFTYMPNVVDGNQCQTYGLSSWLPFQGTGCYYYDAYSFRSFYMASFGMGGLSADNKAGQQQAYAECKEIAPIMLGETIIR
jgi:alpha-galactosidase